MIITNKQKLFFISLIGIVIISLVLVGTFAYQTVNVNYKEGSDNNLTINAGVLDVSYVNTLSINLNNIPLLKDYKTASYTEFTIDNSNSTENVAYSIKLTELEYSNELITKDFKYTLLKKENDNYILYTSGDFSTLNDNEFPFVTSSGNYIDIEKGNKDTYRLYIWLKETSENQNYLENTFFKGKITITSVFDREVIDYSLNGTIYKTIKNNTEDNKTLLSNDTANNNILASSYDNYGKTLYFKGNNIDNYINFGGLCYRIVRIMGDGSIKLILDDNFDVCNGVNYTGNWNIGETSFGSIDFINYSNGLIDKLYEYQTSNLGLSYSYLKNDNWCYEKSTNNSFVCNNEEIVTYKNNIPLYVGLMNMYEVLASSYNNQTYLNSYQKISDIKYSTFTLNNNEIYTVSVNGITTNLLEDVVQIRPSIILNPYVLVSGGNGTIDNPYIID